MYILIISIAFLLDWLLGDPISWPHPVRFIGKLISYIEKKLRKPFKEPIKVLKLKGFFLVFLVLLSVLLFVFISIFLVLKINSWLIYILIIYYIYSALCLKDLYFQTLRVEKSLKVGDFDQARIYLSWIVGRDTMRLDEKSIRRAVIETLSENFSDGLVAPLFYLSFFGVFGLWFYKAINTMDSMIGYKNGKYLYFGRFAAYLDDVVNYIPARLSALILIFSAGFFKCNCKKALKIWWQDHKKHSSPNSGHPEAAMAGVLDIYLGGNSYYGGEIVEKPIINQLGTETAIKHVYMAEKIVVLASIFMIILSSLTVTVLAYFVSLKYFWGF